MQVFARFFNGYMGTAPIVAAALPIPVTALKIIPTYAEQTGYLTTYTSMFCFLVVALVFYRRHRLGSYLLPETWDKRSRIIGRFMISWLPLILTLITLCSIAVYHITLNHAVNLTAGDSANMSEILNVTSTRVLDPWIQARLMVSYFGIFFASTFAFALMAVREYMQDVLQLSEKDMVMKVVDPLTEKGSQLLANKATAADIHS
jgi:membrane-anchored glycerophosphoryl diester phosphodiesterase (GDPDase)